MQSIDVFPGDLIEVIGFNGEKPSGAVLTFYTPSGSIRFIRAVASVVAVCDGTHIVRHDDGLYGSFNPYYDKNRKMGFDESLAGQPTVAFCKLLFVDNNVQKVRGWNPMVDRAPDPGTLFAVVPMRSLCRVLQR